MMVELVTFSLPAGATREQVLEAARTTVAHWQANPELIRKLYLQREDGIGAGLYVWPTREAAQKAHNAEWIAAKEAQTGAAVTISYFDLLMLLDNQAGTVVEP